MLVVVSVGQVGGEADTTIVTLPLRILEKTFTYLDKRTV